MSAPVADGWVKLRQADEAFGDRACAVHRSGWYGAVVDGVLRAYVYRDDDGRYRSVANWRIVVVEPTAPAAWQSAVMVCGLGSRPTLAEAKRVIERRAAAGDWPTGPRPAAARRAS